MESVPVMTRMIALYMGFKEIVFLGIERDDFKTDCYAYAFEPQIQKCKDALVADSGESVFSRHDVFQILARLLRQYRVLREIAQANVVPIINASPTSKFDEFARVRIDDVLGVDA